jgi:aminomethyltransferase
MLAIQGPEAEDVVEELVGAAVSGMGRFRIRAVPGRSDGWLSRTGYTGSDGYELFVRDQDALEFWHRALDALGLQAQPAGLGARDTLRLEACYRLYGNDMDDTTTPDEASLGWVVDMAKADFIGKAALVARRNNPRRVLVGLELEGNEPATHGDCVHRGRSQVGVITSGARQAGP